MSVPIKSREYMLDFQCLGDQCPDTCCHAWRIDITGTDYRRLQGVLGKQRLQASSSILPKDKQKAGVYAYFHHNDQPVTQCINLKDGLCSLQAEFGEAGLATICDVFPRRLLPKKGFNELSGELSCPEVMRRLMTAKNPFDLHAIDPSSLSANLRPQTDHGDSKCFYEGYAASVNETVLQILNLPNPGLQNFYILLYTARRIETIYHRDCTDEAAQRLQKILNQSCLAKHTERILKVFQTPSPHLSNTNKGILFSLLRASRPKRNHARLNLIIADVLVHLMGGDDQVDLDRFEPLDLDQVLETYQSQKATLPCDSQQAIDQICHRIVIHHFAHYNFWDEASLLDHAINLLVVIALMRFCIAGHPHLKNLAQKNHEVAADLVQTVAADVCQASIRYILRDPSVFKIVRESMARQQYGDLNDLLELIRI